MQRGRKSLRAAGFTLVELLVVISIIALLISILLPSLRRARQQAKKVVCTTNMRTLSTASFTYATDEGVYPPSLSNYSNSMGPIRQLRKNSGVDWLGVGDQFGAYTPGTAADPCNTGNPEGFDCAPRRGLLFPLIKEDKAYLCPEDKPGNVDKSSVTGGGGNGKFSYTMFAMMGIRPPEVIPPRFQDQASRPGRGGGGATPRRLPKPALANTPLFVEEHPWGINDKTASGHMEGNFNFGIDRVVSRHPPFTNRIGVFPGETQQRGFKQGTTNIGFADGHVNGLKVNFQIDLGAARTLRNNGDDSIVPDNAEGLLWFFGIEYREATATEKLILTFN